MTRSTMHSKQTQAQQADTDAAMQVGTMAETLEKNKQQQAHADTEQKEQTDKRMARSTMHSKQTQA